MGHVSAIRVGIAGGARGAGFLTGLKSLAGRAELAAVYDPQPAALAAFVDQHPDAAACTTYEQLLDSCDVVVLASPQQFHVPQAELALARGIHVLSEVPAAVSLDQAKSLVGAVRTSSARYALAENYCYTRPNLIIQEMVKQGCFGDIYYGEGEYLHEMKSFHTMPDGSPTWRYFWQVGRDGHTYPTHSLGPLLQWTGDRVTAVSCHGTGRHTDPEHALQDTTVTMMRTAAGRLFVIRFDLLSNRPHLMDYYAIQGTKGAYEASRAEGNEPLVYLEGRSPEAQWEPLEKYADEFLPERYRNPPKGAGHWGADAWPITNLITAVENGDPVDLDVYTALDFSLPALAAEASIARGGAWIDVPDPRFFTNGIGVDPGREAPLT